jgi:hypothetical protein
MQLAAAVVHGLVQVLLQAESSTAVLQDKTTHARQIVGCTILDNAAVPEHPREPFICMKLLQKQTCIMPHAKPAAASGHC